MLPSEVFGHQVQRMAELEHEDPIVCVWRTQAGNDSHESAALFRSAVRAIRRAARKWGRCPKPKPGQVVVLIAGDTPATLGSVRPVIAELHRRGKSPFIVTTRRSRVILDEQLHDGSVDIVTLLSQVHRRERSELKRKADHLARKVRRRLEPYSDGNAGAWILEGLIARRVASRMFYEAGLILADCDIEPWRKGFFLGAASMGVPTVVLQHGLFGPYHFPVHATYLFTWGPYFCHDAARYELGDVKCEPVGCPRWDHLKELRGAPRNDELLKRLNLDPRRPVVLLISNAHGKDVHPEHYRAYFHGVRHLLESDLQVILRLHPAEKGLRYYRGNVPEELLDKLVLCPADVDLYGCVKAANVVYHVFSAASLETMALGVPTLFERGTTGEMLCDYPDHGGGEWSTPEGVVERCRTLAVAGGAREALIGRQDGFVELALANLGQATMRVTDHLERLVVQGGRPPTRGKEKIAQEFREGENR